MDFKKLADSLEQKSKRNIPITDKDYLDNEGLMVCGICHTRKQTVIRMPWGELKKPYCLCKCASERLKENEERIKRQELIQRIKEMRIMGFPDGKMANWTFEKDDNTNLKITTVAKRYVKHFPKMLKDGTGLLFYGNVGSGKTFISACIANELIDQGHPCMVTNFSRIVNTLFGMKEGKQEYLDNLNKFDLLVIDDLAAERDTEYMSEMVHSIVDSRYRSNKPLIVTTNLTREELENPTDIKKQRTYSRLRERCMLVEVSGIDRRREKFVDNFLKARELLGI